ncbi:hypothetical protein BGX29_011837 [Mortierella sp. GBA35]|nr:hypothetical protein BGX29_011837 [Mortierella sp. GBA35]
MAILSAPNLHHNPTNEQEDIWAKCHRDHSSERPPIRETVALRRSAPGMVSQEWEDAQNQLMPPQED